MEILFAKVIELLTSSTKHWLLVVVIVTLFLLLAPLSWLEPLGLITFVSQNRSLLGLVFLSATVMVLVKAATALPGKWPNIRREFLRRRPRQSRLRSLSAHEKAILRGYTNNKVRIRYLPLRYGEVAALCDEGIVSPTTGVAGSSRGWPHTIEQWALEYLNKHAEVLAPDPDEALDDHGKPREIGYESIPYIGQTR